MLITQGLLGVVLLLGNIIVTGWWKVMADRQGDPVVIGFAQRQVTLTDIIFTTGGTILILIGGLGNVMQADHWFAFLNVYWIAWGFWLFNLSGVIWFGILIPVQIKQARMAKTFSTSGVIPEKYWVLNRRWVIWGVIATILPLMNLYWMVFKPV